MLGRIERKGAGTADGGVPSSVVSSARIECEDSTLEGVPATRYVLRPSLMKGRCSRKGNNTYLTTGSTRLPYIERAAKRAAVDCR
jgi:hypothetical protein